MNPDSVYPPVPSLYPIPNYPVPLYSEPFNKRLGKKFAPFAVCSAVRSVPWETVFDGIPVEDSDGIPVELYSLAPTIVTAVVKGEGFTRIDVDMVSLNRVGSPMFFLGRGTCEVGSGVRAAWLTLYIPALACGASPDKLEFGTFSVGTTM